MDNSIYIALSRHLAEFRDMDVTANNIANANTAGYHSEHVLFTSYLSEDINKGERNPMVFANDIASYMNEASGSLKVTGNQLDVAVQGNGYFTVQTPAGIRYTRAGSFQVDSEGRLITPQGYPVLSNGEEEIIFPAEATDIVIGEVGNIKVNGDAFATLGIAKFNNPQLLERTGSNLFRSEVAPQAPEGIRVLQGTLEDSNVQPVLELTHLLDVSRSVASTAKFLEIVHDLERKTSNAWAKQG